MSNPALHRGAAWRNRSFLFCAGASSSLTALCLVRPPFHTLTHEFTTLYAAVAGGLLFFTAAAHARDKVRSGGELPRTALASQALWHSTCLAAAMAFFALSIMGTANGVAFHCTISTGIPYFLLTWFPAALFAASAGVVLGTMGVGKRILAGVFALVLVLSLLHGGLQLYFGPRIYPVDFILGDLAAFSQRGDMAPSRIHVYERGVVLLCALLIWDLGRWRMAGRETAMPGDGGVLMRVARGRAVVLGIVLATGLALWGSHVGLGFGRGALHRAYPVVERTEHFEIRVSGDAELLGKLDAIKRSAEWNWRYLSELWGRELGERVRLYLFESKEDLYRYTGLSYAHAGLGELFVDYEAAQTSVLLHELVHAVHRTLEPSPFILLSRGMLEGTAVAFEGAYTLVPDAHEFQAAALEAGKLPSAQSFMSLAGFARNAEGAAYESAGSFLGFLVLHHGLDKFFALQRSLNFEKTYGKGLEVLDAEWREFLSSVPVSPGLHLRASRFFDLEEYPSYRSAACPKVGARPPTALVQARQFHAMGLYARASALYTELYSEEGDVQWAREAVKSLEAEGEYGAALDALARAEEDLSLKDFERAALLADRIRLLVLLRDWPALYRAYEERAASDAGVPAPNRMGEACLRHSGIRDLYAALFTEDDPFARTALYHEMLEKAPDFGPLLYLYATRGLSPGVGLEARAGALYRAAGHSEEIAGLVAPELVSLYTEAVAEEEYDVAYTACEVLVQSGPKERHRLAGRLGLRRVESERDPGAGGVRIFDGIVDPARLRGR